MSDDNMLEPHTTLKEGQRVKLVYDVFWRNLHVGDLGRVRRGFAGLLGVEFDRCRGDVLIMLNSTAPLDKPFAIDLVEPVEE